MSDAQKLDYLWKKVGYGVAKTADSASKEAFNESIASPLLYRGDLIWTQSGDIPNSPPANTTDLIQVYKDGGGAGYSPSVECVEDLTAPDNQTWLTQLANWVPTQFGDNYLVQVYVAPAGVTNPQTVGTKLFAAGSGNDDTWFFDYQAGLLNFNGANIPSQIATGVTGKSIYIVGYRYVGSYGIDPTAIVDGTSNVQIATTDGNVTISVDGTSNVAVFSTDGEQVTGNISATGNITGNYFVGNGSALTGIVATVGTLANLSVTGNTVTGNLRTAGQVSAAGNVTGNYFVGNGSALTGVVSTGVGTLGNLSVTGNTVTGNLTTAGQVSAAGNISSSNNFVGNGAALLSTMTDRGTDQNDWNTLLQMGVYTVNRVSWSGTTGAPLDSQVFTGLLEVKNSTNTSIEQVFYPGTIESGDVKIQWNRANWNGSWTPWIKIVNNDQIVVGGNY